MEAPTEKREEALKTFEGGSAGTWMETHRMTLRHWTVFRNIDPAQIAQTWDGTGIPQELPGWQGPIRPVEMIMGKEGLDLTDLPHREGTLALCITEIDAPTAMRLAVGAGADWWMEWRVNGQMMFATDDGNGTDAFSIENHRFSLELRPGRNVVSVQVRAGSKGWRLVAASLAVLDPGIDTGIRYRQDLANTERYPCRSFRLGLPTKILAGQIRMPPGEGPFPAIALSHGGGPQNRHGYGRCFNRSISKVEQRFLDLGFMVATWDKPGTGESTGDWASENRSGFIECSRNLIEVVRYIKTLKSCRGLVGVWGLSQGGSVGPMAAGLVDDIDFVIGASSHWGTRDEQELYRIATTLRKKGFPEPDIHDAVHATEELHGIYQTASSVDDAWIRICSLANRYSTQGWFIYSMLRYAREWGPTAVDLSRTTGGPTPLENLAQTLGKTRCPVLLQWGQEDEVVDCRRNVALVHDLIIQHRLRNITIITYPGLDHGLMSADQEGNRNGGLNPANLDPCSQTWADIRTWLTTQGWISHPLLGGSP